MPVYLFDGKNLQSGLGDDLSEAGKEEMVRRFGEVARILLRSCQIVVSTTNSFALADHQIIRILVRPHPIITVHMSFQKGAVPENTDLDFLESDDLKKAAKRIEEKMQEKSFLC